MQLKRYSVVDGGKLSFLSTGSDPEEAVEHLDELPKSSNSSTIFLIDQRRLLGECLGRCISAELGYRVKLFRDIETLQNTEPELDAALIIISTRHGADLPGDYDGINRLAAAAPGARMILLSDSAEVSDFCQSLSRGARGHLPTNVGLDVGMEAVRLVLAGGIYVPADSFVNGPSPTAGAVNDGGKEKSLTSRQTAVVDALRKGKPNKQIAYELNMSESTVKVHIHNIMKKLGAKNRTEVAFKVGDFSAGNQRLG